MNCKFLKKNEFYLGLRQGIPIGLGYLSVSFSFGIQAVNTGLSIFQAALISLTNLTSAGQFAGLSVIATGGSIITMALTQLVINLRYGLMSLALSQKVSPKFNAVKKCFISFFNTDEIFAVAVSRKEMLTFQYMLGLILFPVSGWVGGTFLGAVAAGFIPNSLRSALGIALYAMFIAIIIPSARELKSIRFTISVAMIISCLFYYIPLFIKINSGLVIVFCTIFSSALGAILFPISQKEPQDNL